MHPDGLILSLELMYGFLVEHIVDQFISDKVLLVHRDDFVDSFNFREIVITFLIHWLNAAEKIHSAKTRYNSYKKIKTTKPADLLRFEWLRLNHQGP